MSNKTEVQKAVKDVLVQMQNTIQACVENQELTATLDGAEKMVAIVQKLSKKYNVTFNTTDEEVSEGVRYIVYNKSTNEVVKVLKWYGKEIEKIVEAGKGKLAWLNTSHPKNEDKLKELIYPEGIKS